MDITLFDRPYPRDKQIEAIAIHQSVVTGECFKCQDYKVCSAGGTFKFSLDNPCMKRKKELLEVAQE